MSATNQTAVYGLPIFLGTDVPSWLTDWNGAMGDIDTAIAAAKAAADAAASTAGTAATDIVTINGQITSLQNTVGTNTTQIGTISGNINTINSLIGNGTPTTTDQTIIGAINELHANQGDLANLTTTDKSSLVAAINEAAQSGGGGSESVRYYNGYIQYSTDGGVTWINLINVNTPVQVLPVMTSASSAFGNFSLQNTAVATSPISSEPYKVVDGSGSSQTNYLKIDGTSDYVQFDFATAQYLKYMCIYVFQDSGTLNTDINLEVKKSGSWVSVDSENIAGQTTPLQITGAINDTVEAIRFRCSGGNTINIYQLEAFN